jgi:hypothetical protein
MDQRTQFIADYLREVLSITELCALYRVTRKTGYKWIDRYLRQGPAGLEERSRPYCPKTHPMLRLHGGSSAIALLAGLDSVPGSRQRQRLPG